MKKSKGLGESPLNGMFSPTVDEPRAGKQTKQSGQRKQREHREHSRQVEPIPARAQLRFTVHLPADLVEQLRRAVYWTPGATLSGLAEQALRQAVGRLEKERGEAFPDTRGSIRGRPVR
jgi:hypothetical protein